MQKTDSQIFWGSRYCYDVMVAYYHVCAEYLCSSYSVMEQNIWNYSNDAKEDEFSCCFFTNLMAV